MKEKIVIWLTYIMLAVGAALLGLYGYGMYLRKESMAADQRHVLELAERIHWIGTIDTRRYWATPDPARPGRNREDSLLLYNRSIELGLRADGTVVWRKAGPTPVQK